MPYLVDGNNVAGGKDRAKVRRAALRLAERERLRIILYFDGAPPAGVKEVERLGAVEVRYVPHADDAMLAFLQGAGLGWRVVTSDRKLAERAKNLGATVLPAQAFWDKVAASTEAEVNDDHFFEDVEAFYRSVTPLAPAAERVRRRNRKRGSDLSGGPHFRARQRRA
ncbi:MAG: hypothetical protein ACUVRY_04910 [Thermoanaerobaculaceae bacterium]